MRDRVKKKMFCSKIQNLYLNILEILLKLFLTFLTRYICEPNKFIYLPEKRKRADHDGWFCKSLLSAENFHLYLPDNEKPLKKFYLHACR